jgi:hypothetical protein
MKRRANKNGASTKEEQTDIPKANKHRANKHSKAQINEALSEA